MDFRERTVLPTVLPFSIQYSTSVSLMLNKAIVSVSTGMYFSVAKQLFSILTHVQTNLHTI